MNTLQRLKSMASALALTLAPLTSASDVDPYEQPDNSQITLSGTMSNIDGDEFVLAYDGGRITVELDDWSQNGEDLGFMNGSEVTVFGEIDDNLFTASTIEAEAVYVKRTGSYYYAPDRDAATQAHRAFMWSEPENYQISDMTVRGRVISVDHDNRQFTIAVGGGDAVTVATAALDYDPLKSGERDPVDEGDWVRVAGRLDYEFLEGKVIRARSIITLYEDVDPA